MYISMETDPEVIFFYQKQIINSGLLLDEDITLIQTIEYKEPNKRDYALQGLPVLGQAIGTACCAAKGEGMRLGLLFSLPAAFSLLQTLYQRRKAASQKKLMVQLLTVFRSLSNVHTEVNDFIKCFNHSSGTEKDRHLKFSEDTIYDLTKHTCDTEGSITKQLLNVIKELHVDIKEILFDLSGFERTTSISLTQSNISDCLQNIYFVEGQVVLLRSHLLTSLIFVSSSRGNPAGFKKLLDEFLPSLVFLIENGVQKIRHKLNDVRFPKKPSPLVSLSKLENIEGDRKHVSVPKLKKHVIKINDGICCTLMKLRSLLETLDNVESESEMIMLQESVRNVSKELLKCCLSAADLEKLIISLNRNQNNETSDLLTVTEVRDEDNSTTSLSENRSSESDVTASDTHFQLFGNDINDSEDEELNAVRFYKKHTSNTADWLAELEQSDEFQKRKSRFTAKPATSTPVEPVVRSAEQIKSVVSLDSTPPRESVPLGIPPPPPMPTPVSSSSELPEVLNYSPASTSNHKSVSSGNNATRDEQIRRLPENPSPENSSLLNAVMGVLDKMGQQLEDEFE